MERWKPPARATLRGATLVLLIATLVGFLGTLGWVPEILSNLRPQYLFALTLAGAFLAWTGDPLRAAAAFGGAGLNLALVLPVLLPTAAAPEADLDRTLSVMALNVSVSRADVNEIGAYLRTRDDDLVFLFAATDRYSRPLREMDIPYHVVVARPPRTSLEIILLARDPLVLTRIHWWGSDTRSAVVEAEVMLGETRVRVIGTHPKSPRTPTRAAQRNRQLARLGAWVAGESDPVLLVGDLNVTPWSPRFRAMAREAGLVDSLRRIVGLQPSWPAPITWIGIPIDHALHTPDLVTVDRSLGPSFGASHRAVHITVAPALPPLPSRPRSSRAPAGAP